MSSSSNRKQLPVELYLDIISKSKYEDIIKMCNTPHIRNICSNNKNFVARAIFKDRKYDVSGISNLGLLFSRFYEIDKKIARNYHNLERSIDRNYDDVLHLLLNNLNKNEKTNSETMGKVYKIDRAMIHAITKNNLDAVRMIMPHVIHKRFAPVYALMHGNIEAFKILFSYFELEEGEGLGEGIVAAVVENRVTDKVILAKVINYAMSVDPTFTV